MPRSIKKSSGTWEHFSTEKLERSLSSVGVAPDIQKKLISEISHAPEVRTTEDIYEYAYFYLKLIDRPLAARYSLKKSLYALGPHKSSFVQFMAKVFAAQEYTVRIDHRVKGLCLSLEADLIIEKDEQRFLVACEFEYEPGVHTATKDALSTKALLEDILKAQDSPLSFSGALLATNVPFTDQAISYAACTSLKLLGWAYPETDSLGTLVDTFGLYPVTCLTSLTTAQKRILVQKNILLCRELLTHSHQLKKIQVPGELRSRVIDECKSLSFSNSFT